jgi:hypothetical protein
MGLSAILQCFLDDALNELQQEEDVLDALKNKK